MSQLSPWHVHYTLAGRTARKCSAQRCLMGMSAYLPAQIPGSNLLVIRVVDQPMPQNRTPLGEEVIYQQADELLPAPKH